MLFFGSRTTLAKSGILHGFTDWHCHLLPDVDDGVRTLDETLHILALYEEQGVKEVWFTPHIMEDIPNKTADLSVKFRNLQTIYQGKMILHLAAENMLDNLFEERLEAGDLLPLGEDGNHLLVETSYFHPPMGLENIFSRIKKKGYFPVLAHPERYMYMDEDDYFRLKEMGVKFQMNLPSIVGLYGTDVRKKAEWLLRKGFYNFAGTDTHRLASLQIALTKKVKKSVSKYCLPFTI